MEVEHTHNFFVGKNAVLVHNGGDCVPSYAMHTIEMDDINTKGMRDRFPGLTGKSRGYIVYVVRDMDSGEFLKVGQTDTFRTRFGEYATTARKEGRRIAIDMFEVDKHIAQKLDPTLESQMQKSLFDKGHPLPWDQSVSLRKPRRGKP